MNNTKVVSIFQQRKNTPSPLQFLFLFLCAQNLRRLDKKKEEKEEEEEEINLINNVMTHLAEIKIIKMNYLASPTFLQKKKMLFSN